MAKVQPKKKTSPVVWLGLVGVAVAAYVVLNPADDAKPAAKPKSKTAKKIGNGTDFTKQDFIAADHPFAPLKGPVVDAFKPSIIRSTGQTSPTGFPLDLGGGAGWSYSGMVVVDGVGKGLLENGSTGESVFLCRGQKWENARAGDIYPDHMILIGPEGPITVSVVEKDSSPNTPAEATTTALPAPAPPVQPLRGDIGVQDLTVDVVPDATATRGNRRRRRG
jgi:hypothetical protein